VLSGRVRVRTLDFFGGVVGLCRSEVHEDFLLRLTTAISGLITVGTEKRREKTVVLRELQRAIIYTRELSKQGIEGHVSMAFIVYSVNESARLTPYIFCQKAMY
jgi:hypothetical protein